MECDFLDLRSFSASMLGIRHILPGSIQHAGDSSSGSADGEHIVATKNRWSRVVFNFQDVTPDLWCEFSFRISFHQAETVHNIHDYASVGVDFLTEDGSSIDFPYVPGLVRAQIDPYNEFIAGPAHDGQSIGPAQTRHVHCNFLIPAPTKQIAISIRGWRNSQPFQISNAALHQFTRSGSTASADEQAGLAPTQADVEASSRIRRNWKVLSTVPQWFSYSIVPGRPLFVRGQVIADQADKDGALVRVVFRNARGEELPPPYPETLITPATGAFIGIPTHMQARRFTLELVPPSGAATVDLGFQSWHDTVPMKLAAPLEVSLENGLLLENVMGEETQNTTTFLTEALRKADAYQGPRSHDHAGLVDAVLDKDALSSTLRVHQSLAAVQHGASNQEAADTLRLGGFSNWTLPAVPTWNEDPFRSPAWRLEFQSLSWLLPMAKGSKRDGLPNAIALALSWSRASFDEQSVDALRDHPLSSSVRAEVLLELLTLAASSSQKNSLPLVELTGEIVRHCFTLSEILSQNIFSYSIHQIHVASSLYALAAALPRIPFSAYWRSLALGRLREGFDELIGPGGEFFEKSQHNRLELLSLGLIMSAALEKVLEAYNVRQDLAPRLKKAALATIILTDPAGMLPPFGETPHGYHHAAWLRRLISQFGQGWIKDKAIRRELEYPEGSREFPSAHTGVLAARHYEQGREWSYFCASVLEQRQSHEHSDSTSFVYSAGGARWITDSSGSSQFEVGAARQYLVASRAHNVALPDGREQTAGTSWLQSKSSVGDISIYEVCSTVHGPEYAHRRIFMMTKGLGAIAVFDHFQTAQRPFTVEGFLHFEPEVMVAIASSQLVMGFSGQKRLRIIPHLVAGRLGGLEISQGLNTQASALQGFISRNPGGLEPASVLRYRFAGHENICGGMIMTLDRQNLAAITQAISDPDVKRLLVP
jgi:hypothetical protein